MFVPAPMLIIGGLVIAALLLIIVMRGRGVGRGYGQDDELSVDRHRDASPRPNMHPGRQPAIVHVPAYSSIGEGYEAMSVEARAELLRLLRARRKIEAIKLLRDETGGGLKEAKDFVESLEIDGDGRL